jgi:hypothetical protein
VNITNHNRSDFTGCIAQKQTALWINPNHLPGDWLASGSIDPHPLIAEGQALFPRLLERFGAYLYTPGK